MDLERGTLNDMYRYGITPPTNPRERKLFKERDRSQKIKVAKREGSLTKNMRRVTITKTFPSDEYADDDTLEGEQSPADGNKRRKDTLKTFKTTRAYDRDYKNSSNDLQSLENVTPKQSASGNMHQIHVDSPNRFMSLSSKPVSSLETKHKTDSLFPKSLTSQKRQHSFTSRECPKDRYDFHKIFSQLIALHLKPKVEKENKLSRQISADQELYQNQMSDVIWLSLRAWHNDRAIQQEDEYVSKAREKIPELIKKIMEFKYKKSEKYATCSK